MTHRQPAPAGHPRADTEPTDMLVVDSQVHLWAPHTPDRPWPADADASAHHRDSLGADDLLAEMQAAGVDRAVIVPPSFAGDDNDLALQAAGRHPDRFAVMGRLPLDDPRGPELVDRWRQQPGMLGVRLTLHRPRQQRWLRDGTADWFWPAAEAAGLPVMVFAPGHLDLLARVAGAHPGLRLVVDHMGLPGGATDAELSPALEGLWPLARFPNVAVKASGLPAHVSEPYPFPSLHGHVLRAVETFGPQRVFWGSDMTRMPCPYREVVDLFGREVGFHSDEQRRKVMGEAVLEWLGWSH